MVGSFALVSRNPYQSFAQKVSGTPPSSRAAYHTSTQSSPVSIFSYLFMIAISLLI